MQKLLDGQVYDPRIKSSSTMTKMRVIAHDDHLESKDYKTTLNDALPPQQHRDYVASDEKGPRERRMEAAIANQIANEEVDRADNLTTLNNERFLVTTNQATFQGEGFQGTQLGSGTSTNSQMKRRDPYYVKDAAITYYLHTALHGKNFDFPATPIGDLNKIWLKGSSFTSGISKCIGLETMYTFHYSSIYIPNMCVYVGVDPATTSPASLLCLCVAVKCG